MPVNQSRNSYSQDSYINQSNTNNYANVAQIDNRTGGSLTNGSGSSAAIEQTGTFNNAYQTQSLDNATSLGGTNSRNEMRTTQAGTRNESRQAQNGGYRNTAAVTQATGSETSYATQTQNGGHDNSAQITQSKYQSDPNVRNSASQTQSGDNNKARIGQQGQSSVVTQTQTGSSNSADGYQGARGKNNTIIQEQSGSNNRAYAIQSSFDPQLDFDRNYAKQNQGGTNNSATIDQRGHDSYSEQVQTGNMNATRIQQGQTGTSSYVASAAYTTQSGSQNSATVVQR